MPWHLPILNSYVQMHFLDMETKMYSKRILDISPEVPYRTISPHEAHSQAMSSINSRLNQDKILTSRKRYGKKVLPEHLVLSTWCSTLKDESSQPENWLWASRVLVGIPFQTISSFGIGWAPHYLCINAFLVVEFSQLETLRRLYLY